MRFKALNVVTAEHFVLQRTVFSVKMESELTDQRAFLFRKSLKVGARG
jgi:hypothetical protein